jgi:FtsZ-interacting cell division protein ZipA
LEIVDRVAEDSVSAAQDDSTQVVEKEPASVDQPKISKSNLDLQLADKERKTPTPELLSVSNPEVSFAQRKESIIVNAVVPEENRTSPAGAAAVAAAAAAAAAAVKHTDMRSPMFIRQEVINYLGISILLLNLSLVY